MMSLIATLSIMEDFGFKMHKKLFTFTPHLVIEETISENLYNQLKTRDEVVNINRYTEQDIILKTQDGLFSGAISRGYNTKDLKDFLNLFQELKYPYGLSSPLKPKDLESQDIILTSDLSYNLDLLEGDEILLLLPESLLLPAGEIPQYEKAHIRSLLSTQIAQTYLKHIFYNSEKSLKIFKTTSQQEKRTEIFLKNPHQLTPLKSKLKSLGKKVSSWKERHSQLFFALKMEKLIMLLFLSLSVLITSFSILTLLMLLISQKRKDISMLIAMGLSPKKVRKVFTQIGVWISTLGIFGGIALGLSIALLLEYHPLDLLPSRLYYDSAISAKINMKFVSIVIIASLGLAFTGSRMASRFYIQLEPADALKGKKRS